RIELGFFLVSFRKGANHFKRIGKIRSDAEYVRMADDFLFPKACFAREHTGFQEVIAHQFLGGFSRRRVFVAELLRDLLLEFKLEDVKVAASAKMEKVSDAVVKIHRLCGKQMPARGFNRLSNPPGPMHIAQAARRFLAV